MRGNPRDTAVADPYDAARDAVARQLLKSVVVTGTGLSVRPNERTPRAIEDRYTLARRLVLWTTLAAACAVALLWALFLVRHAILLIYISCLLAIGVSPIVRLLETPRVRWLGVHRLPRAVAILLVYAVVVGTAALVGFIVVTPLVRQVKALVAALPGMIDRAQQFLVSYGVLDQASDWQFLIQKTPAFDALHVIFGAVGGVLGGVVGVLTIIVLPFYLLIEAESIRLAFLRLFPRGQRPRVEAASHETAQKLSAWLGGQILLSAIIGCSACAGLWLMGVPYFFVLALAAAVGELIPVVGPLLAAVPAVAVALTVSWRVALSVAVFYLVQQQVENHVIVPKLMGHQLGVNAVTIIVALLVGSSLLGVMGAILAVPTAAVAQVLFHELVPDAGAEGGAAIRPREDS